MTDLTKLQSVTVQVTRTGTELPAQDVAVLLSVRMPRKNSYSVGPKITGTIGEVVFHRDEIEHEIDLCKNASPMDYQGGLDEAIAIEGEVLDSSAIHSLIQARKMWGSVISEWHLGVEEEKLLLSPKIQQWAHSVSVLPVDALERLASNIHIELKAQLSRT